MSTLTRTSLILLAVFLTAAATCQAQVIVHPVYAHASHFGYRVPTLAYGPPNLNYYRAPAPRYVTWRYHASTAAEGYMRGRADVLRSQGYANYFNSQAAINYSIARHNEIANRLEGTKTYFNMRETNRHARAAERGPQQTEEARVRIAKQAAPKGLSPSEFDAVAGEINWPTLLRYDSLSQKRTTLEQIFHQRADTGSMNGEDYTKANDTINTLLADLRGAVRKVSPTQYTEAKQFLEGLAYEAGRPVR